MFLRAIIARITLLPAFTRPCPGKARGLNRDMSTRKNNNMQRRSLSTLVLIVIVTLMAGCKPITAPPVLSAANPNVIDSHLHYFDFTQQTDGFGALVQAMDAAHIGRAVVFGMPIVKMWPESEPIRPAYYLDTDAPAYYYSATDLLMANQLLQQPPEVQARFFPFLGGINPLDQNAADYLEMVIASYPPGFWRGIGEIMSRHDDLTAFTYGEPPRADHPALMKVYQLAARHHLPVLIHHNISSASQRDPIYLPELERAVAANPDTTFIWAHVGISRRVDVPTLLTELRRLLATYPNLNVDISWVVYPDYINRDDASLQAWAEVIEEFPDRFLIGSDKVGRWKGYTDMIRQYDTLLNRLSPETAAAIAGGNLLKLLGQP